MHCKSIDKSQKINFGIYKYVPLFAGKYGPKYGPKILMEISPNISEMESSIGKIKKMESSVGKIKNLMD